MTRLTNPECIKESYESEVLGEAVLDDMRTILRALIATVFFVVPSGVLMIHVTPLFTTLGLMPVEAD